MAAAKKPTKAQVKKYLTDLLDEDMSMGNRAAITRVLQILNNERKLK